MKTEAVMTCVGRSSFLRETLPLNRDKFNNIIVVTTPTDYETQRVCKDHEVSCVETDSFYMHGAPFDKGRALNIGLDNLKFNDWVVFTDCDIVFMPPHVGLFRDTNLDKEKMYGAKRIVFKTRKEFESFTKQMAFTPYLLNPDDLVDREGKDIGVGYFQMINVQSKIIKEIKDTVIYADDESFELIVLPTVNGDKNYPRILKDSGKIYPYFPHAGGSDAHFRHFFGAKNALLGVPAPVIHLGRTGRGHSGQGRNFQ